MATYTRLETKFGHSRRNLIFAAAYDSGLGETQEFYIGFITREIFQYSKFYTKDYGNFVLKNEILFSL